MERKYSITEIDRMRYAVAQLSHSKDGIEDRLRTYMQNGTDPEELEEEVKNRPPGMYAGTAHGNYVGEAVGAVIDEKGLMSFPSSWVEGVEAGQPWTHRGDDVVSGPPSGAYESWFSGGKRYAVDQVHEAGVSVRDDNGRSVYFTGKLFRATFKKTADA